LGARARIVLLVLVAATGACSSSAKTAAPATTAPDAIRADFHTFVTAEDTLLDAFKAADYNDENLAPTAFQVLDAAPVATAGSHISAYMHQVCGITTTTK
jgi:hypothetical protein